MQGMIWLSCACTCDVSNLKYIYSLGPTGMYLKFPVQAVFHKYYTLFWQVAMLLSDDHMS